MYSCCGESVVAVFDNGNGPSERLERTGCNKGVRSRDLRRASYFLLLIPLFHKEKRTRKFSNEARQFGCLILALERLMEGNGWLMAGNGQGPKAKGQIPSKESPCLCNKHE